MNRLRELRKERGLTLDWVSVVTNINSVYLSRYETGKVSPNISTLIKLADYYDVSIDYLVGRSDVR